MPNNKTGSLKRLASLVQRLKRNGKLEDYDAIIQQQLEEGVVKEAEEPAQVKEFYIPHKAVIRESSEATKMRIVYDASARAHDAAPSLNECLESGPPLQNQLWKVLVRGRFNAVAIAGDIQKALLQVRIRAEDRDALRFHWITREYPQASTYPAIHTSSVFFFWAHHLFSSGESFSITSTSVDLITLMLYQRLSGVCMWMTC